MSVSPKPPLPQSWWMPQARSVTEIARLIHRPRAVAVAEPDHDAVLAAVHVGRTVIAHRHDVEVAVAVEIVDLELGVALFLVRILKAGRSGDERHAAARRRLVAAAPGIAACAKGQDQG